ncbi:hypothetical protein D8I35_03300 [Corticibacter populi]|uniref:Toxin co-regulated pilus biosynthesis protein Q C-terminal domain-containing protein n=1 Tax=Corticibacter populi TaxID=1550736 RepID=A0A3M6QYQ3_9BURK|nr:TcpQ domain-containing protein [Corticibacter populi]RMX08156.1 hypothetical protein D8I35_03300 [Corticibacter populi]RZS35417.1 conjugative transfer region protein (TIGR03748 family) [Corticibacter populi]
MAPSHSLKSKASIAALVVATLTGCNSVSLDPNATDGAYSVHQPAPQAQRQEAPAPQQRVSRYTTAESRPDAGVVEPLQAVVQITYPRDVRTIEAALDYTLMRSGYSLALPTTVEQQRFRGLPLPESQRTLGPYTVEQILHTLLGTEWQLVINAPQRVVGFVEPPSPIGSASLPTPLPAVAPVAAVPVPASAASSVSAEPVTVAPVAASNASTSAAPTSSAISAVPAKASATSTSAFPPAASAQADSGEVSASAEPSSSTPAARWDVLLTDVTLAQTFLRWGKDAGYRVKWDAAKHVLIGATDSYQRLSFEDAVTAALSTPGIQHSEYPLEACFYPNNPPLVRITRRGEQDKECQ